MKLEDLECGDLVIVDGGDLGFDIYDREGNRVCFVNRIGEAILLEWLKIKSQESPSWVERNVNRIKNEKGWTDDFHC